jgi:sec-independent protein translocase protein TatA
MAVLFAFFDILGSSELLILAVVAVLLYGERLPEVARTWGKQLTEFKKGLDGIRQELQAAVSTTTTAVTQALPREEDFDREEPTAPKFEPPPSDPSDVALGDPPPSEPAPENH